MNKKKRVSISLGVLFAALCMVSCGRQKKMSLQKINRKMI